MPTHSNATTLALLSSAIALAIAAPATAQQAAKPAELPAVVVEGSQAKAKAPKKVAKKSVAPKAKAAPAPAAPAPQPDENAAAAAGGEETAKGAVDGVVAKRSASGTKTDTPIISTPQSISVVGRDQMERQGAQTLTEATRYLPGIRSDTFGNDTRSDFFLIRGFAAEQTGYYLDGLQLFSTGFANYKLEPWNLERIEVIRGPSAVLYGGGNPGGLVNAVSKRPGPDATRTVASGIDEYGNRFGAVDVGGSLGSGELYYRVNALGRMGDTQVDGVDNDRFFIAPSLLWRPNSDTSLTVLTSYQKDKTDIVSFLPYEGTVKAAPFGRIPRSLSISEGFGSFEREQAMAGYEFEHDVNDAVTVRQNLRYAKLEIDQVGYFGFGYVAPPTSTSASLTRFNFVTFPEAEQLNVDNQAEVRFGTGLLQHKVLAGLDYKHYSQDANSNSTFGPSLDLLNPQPQPVAPAATGNFAELSQQQVGVYLQDQIKINRLTVALSGRHDWVETDRDDISNPSQTISAVNQTAYSGRAGAIYNFDNGIAPYVSYSTSFDPQLGLNATTKDLLKPEKGRGFEAGVKYEPRGMNARFTAGYFDIVKSNVVTSVPAIPAALSRQIAEVESEGFEFEAVATPLPGLDVIGSYTVYNLETAKNGNSALDGLVPTGVPEQFGGLFVDYTLQYGLFKGFGFGGGVRYNGRSFADEANLLEVPSYTLADATLHYERDGWRTALTVSNLFDDTYVGGCQGSSFCFYGEGRKAMLTAAYKW